MEEFKMNDFVWAKMAGYPPWPSIVIEPDPLAPPKQKDTQWIYFFGSHNYAWIEERNIKHFEEYKEKFKTTYKQGTFREAVEELEDIIDNMKKDPDYKIDFIKYTPKERKSSPRKARKSSSSVSVKRPLKEKNSPIPKKKSRSSISGPIEPDESIELEVPLNRSQSVTRLMDTSKIMTSSKTFGFLAGNIVSAGIIKNLIKSGHRLQIWSRSSVLCEEMKEYADAAQADLRTCNTPREVVRNSDITLSCLSDPQIASETIQSFGMADENDDLLLGKGYVEMTGIGPELSKDLCDMIEKKGGRYLEAQVQGGKQESIEGEMVILAAGNGEVYKDCQSCFKAIGKASFYLDRVGCATKANLIYQLMKGVFLAGLAEGFAMADRSGILPTPFLQIFRFTTMASDYLLGKADMMVEKKFTQVEEPVQQLQKDVSLGLELSNKFRQPMPLASNANEILKHARRLGYDNQDSSCIYQRTRY